MQTALKTSFWLSVVAAINASALGCMAGDYWPSYLPVIVFAVPAVFIKQRLYRIAAAFIASAWLLFTYQDIQAGKHHVVWKQRMKERDSLVPPT